MKTSWKASVVAVGMALALAGAGAVLATPAEGKGRYGHAKGKGRGGKRGRDGKADKPGKRACDEVTVDAVLAVVDAACPCAGLDDGAGGTTPWKNHGAYVRCVKHTLRDALREAGLKNRCARGIVPCAARSACGKRGAVACIVSTPGVCVDGACGHDPATSCVTDGDCTVRECSVTRDGDCTVLGGVPAPGSCCTGSPSGAFLE